MYIHMYIHMYNNIPPPLEVHMANSKTGTKAGLAGFSFCRLSLDDIDNMN